MHLTAKQVTDIWLKLATQNKKVKNESLEIMSFLGSDLLIHPDVRNNSFLVLFTKKNKILVLYVIWIKIRGHASVKSAQLLQSCIIEVVSSSHVTNSN